MNGFELHRKSFTNRRNPNIHLSASTLNLWINAPDVFVAEKLLGHRSSLGPAPLRGIVIEDGVVDVLHRGKALDVAIADAQKSFDKRVILSTPATEKERAMIAPCITLATRELAQLGKPDFPDDGGQIGGTLDCRCDGFTVPFQYFLDLVYADKGLVVDLKTTNRMPTMMASSHQIQRCLYQKARGNQQVKFLYVTSKKAEWREDGDVTDVLATVKLQTERLERFLRISPDPKALAAIVPHNPDNFYWRGSEDTRRVVFETKGEKDEF